MVISLYIVLDITVHVINKPNFILNILSIEKTLQILKWIG